MMMKGNSQNLQLQRLPLNPATVLFGKDDMLNEVCTQNIEIESGQPFKPPDDNFTWLKYGQKDLAKTQLRRCYYRCVEYKSRRCPAKRFVSFRVESPDECHVEYTGNHNHKQESHSKRSPSEGDACQRDNIKPRDVLLEFPTVEHQKLALTKLEQFCLQRTPSLLTINRDSTVSSEHEACWTDLSSPKYELESALMCPPKDRRTNSTDLGQKVPNFSRQSSDVTCYEGLIQGGLLSYSSCGSDYEANTLESLVRSCAMPAEFSIPERSECSREFHVPLVKQPATKTPEEIFGVEMTTTLAQDVMTPSNPISAGGGSGLLLPFPSKRPRLNVISTPIGKFPVLGESKT